MTTEVRPLYCAGRFLETGEILEVKNPYSGKVDQRVSEARPQDLEAAITAAEAAFAATRALPTWQRAEILEQIASGLKARAEEIALTIARESGKPLKDARGEVTRGISTFHLAAGEVERWGGELLPLDILPSAQGRFGIVKHHPIGPIAGISPFNFPLNLVAHKVAPALATGNPIVIKPASKTPVTSLILAEIIDQTAWPKGGFSVLPASREVGERLVTDPRFAMLSFTGSPAVGWPMKERAGVRKKVVLELGGNAGVYIDERAPFDFAIRRTAYGAFANAGQICISVQRLFIHERVYDQVLSGLIAATQKLKVGDPTDPTTDLGPLIDHQAAEKTRAWIREAEEAGTRILLGGYGEGNVVPPTILEHPATHLRIYQEEAFAPVLAVYRVASAEEGFAGLNNSRFGLQAGVFTDNQEVAWRAFDALDVGGVIINDVPTFRVDNFPYGGVKDSGWGREGVRYAMHDMTELKVMVVNREVGR